jgi:hypothetical protein
MDVDQLDAFMNRPETAAAHEAMDALRDAREKADVNNPNKNSKESNFDDILGPVTRETSPGEGSSRKRPPQGSSEGVEASKRARSDNYRGPPSTDQYNRFPDDRPQTDENIRRSRTSILPQERSGRMDGLPEYPPVPLPHNDLPSVTVSNAQHFMPPEGRGHEAMQLISYHLTKSVKAQVILEHSESPLTMCATTVIARTMRMCFLHP